MLWSYWHASLSASCLIDHLIHPEISRRVLCMMRRLVPLYFLINCPLDLGRTFTFLSSECTLLV